MKDINMKVLFAMLLSCFTCACSDDQPIAGDEFCEEGQPATVSLNIETSNMAVLTRSLADDEEASNYIHDLFLALYAKDGKRLCYYYLDDLEENPNVTVATGTINLDWEVESAQEATIVAVANIAYEYKAYVDYFESSATSTLARMQNVVYTRVDQSDVNLYSGTFLMSGYYREGEETYSTVTIYPGKNALKGKIYLKRLYAYNKFEISAGNHISMKLNTWKVCNVPPGCYLLENGKNAYTYHNSYKETDASHNFSLDGTTSSFEFYQLENNYTALPYEELTDGDWVGIKEDADPSAMYACRERQFRDDAGRNNGLFKALTKERSSLDDATNNNATYVVVNADVDYYIEDTPENRANPEEAVAVAYSAEAKLIHRVANVDYLIHLGYCLEKDDAGQPTLQTAMDFNCSRNTRYLYKVKIDGVNKVVLEAKSSEEQQPGAHGTVTDLYADEVELDAHYCTFNVKFSDEERAYLKYKVTAPYNGVTQVFERNSAGDYDAAWEENELFSWIKFAPTTDEGTLAPYNGGEGLWSIEQLCDLSYANPNAAEEDGSRWYTVFVDEYVYHDADEGGVESSWKNYTNQDDRKVEFIDGSNVSSDTGSEYAYCKYLFAQKSIQTFYDYDRMDTGEVALGVEHTDETFCLNMVWNTSKQSTSRTKSNYNYENGRANIYNYLNKTSWLWSDVVSEELPCSVLADENTTSYISTSHPAVTYPVALPKSIGTGSVAGRPSPNDLREFYANAICMNRNRDLNGNGTIDPEEIRWYLPTSNQYIQISIGQNELPDPLIRFNKHAASEFQENTGTNERRGTFYYHHVTSDYQYFWAEQLVNVGNGPLNQWRTVCYTVKCVRALGANPGDATDMKSLSSNPVADTYSHDASAHTVTMSKYQEASLRGYTAGPLTPHSVAEKACAPYRKFEYASSICKGIEGSYVSVDENGLLTFNNGETSNLDRTEAWTKSLRRNGVCGKYSQESDESDLGSWRVPNLNEVAVMYMIGLLQSDNGYVLSCSHDYFYDYDLKVSSVCKCLYMGYNNASDRKVLARDIINNSGVKIRCVRDVYSN